MTSNKKRSSLGLALGISLGLASAGTVVNAGSIGDTYTTGDTLTAAKMDNIKTAVNDNDTRVTGNTTSIGTLNTTVGGHTTSIGTLNTTVGGHTTSIGTLQTDVANLKSGTGTCVGSAVPGDTMVRVGSICVDKYEAKIVSGVAQSVATDTPTSGVDWITAANACAMAGKRLPTNAEWQVAATGTTTISCNTAANGSNTGVVSASNTFPACVSSYSVANMIGNAVEWVADWQNVVTDGDILEASNPQGDFGILRGGDTSDVGGVGWLSAGASLGDTLPPGGGGLGIGFRCVR